ncbi:hypothetical protein ACFFRR_000125 [Megaselia abdita]
MKLFAVILGLAATAAYAAVPATEYLPPSDVLNVNPLELQDLSETSALSEDGYRYKTVRKLRKYRHRRDVSELPTAEYLPPLDAVPSEVSEVAVESAPLADDGYRYKTIRKLKYRHRRDVNELPAEYLPPVEETQPSEVAVESAPLADDGYRYKTVRKLKYRHRRDVNELSAEYLPPVEETQASEVAESAAIESAPLADDGYRYKTIRKLKYRHRRDVSDIPIPFPSNFDFAANFPEEAGVVPVDESGYKYRTVRRLRVRKRRAAIDLPTGEYLPPVEETAIPEASTVLEEAPASHNLSDDGYRYKTVRKLKYRHRRDVSDIPEAEYLPPLEEASSADSSVLADDGYRYKTLKKFKVRRH